MGEGRRGSSGAEVLALEGLAELPVAGGDVPGGGTATVAGGDPEGEGLADELRVGLPELAPVAGHRRPPQSVPLYLHAVDVAGAGDVPHQHQVEVGVPRDGEPDPSLLLAWDPATDKSAEFHLVRRGCWGWRGGDLPAVGDGDDTSLVLRDLEEGGLGEVEVGAGGIAPAAVVAGEGVVRGTVVGAADEDGGVAGLAPLRVVDALNLVAGAAG